jgi:hypothetical protein
MSAVFPFTTVWFERWAGRRGFLTPAGEPQERTPQAEQNAAV